MHAKVRREKITGRGGVDKTAVVGARDRATGQVAAEVIESVDGATLRGFVADRTTPEMMVYTDGATADRGRERREAVYHSVGEYVRGQAYSNGVESYWAALPTRSRERRSIRERQRRRRADATRNAF